MVKVKISLKPKEKLLKYLIENKEPVSIRHASGAILVDYKNTYGDVDALVASGAIIRRVMGNNSPIQLSLNPRQEIFSVEEKRTQEFLIKNPKLRLVKENIEKLNYPFLVVLIFGSYVKNTNNVASDIDICIISDNEKKKKELLEKFSLLSLKLEIQDFSSDEFVSMLEKKQENLAHEIIKKNIILFGIENYYNLIKNGQQTNRTL